MAENESIWKRLTRLFRSGPVVRHKIAAGERLNEPQGTARAYKRELSSLYVNSLASYGQYERLARYADYGEMEMCLAPNTLIAVPGGFKTIKELADECTAKREAGLDDSFIVYSYDHQKKKIVPAIAKHARKTRTEKVTRVTFDTGKIIEGTFDHRLMLRDGSYSAICDLEVGDRLMPFRRNHRYGSEYVSVYNGSSWEVEHRLIAEFISNRKLSSNEIVHHLDGDKSNNRPENLQVMTNSEHSSLHLRELNKLKWSKENERWISKFKENHSKFMTENNPAERTDITFAKILQVAENNDFNLYKVMSVLDIDYPIVMRRLLKYSFNSWETFSKTYKPDWRNHGWDNAGSKNPRWDDELTVENICNAFEKGIRPITLAQKLNTTCAKIKTRVKQLGFKSAADFCDNYENCKVVKIERLEEEIDVYDLTVDGYKNFATDTVISHNTPEIASALNIYADEATCKNEHGETIKITSKNDAIKEILEELFFDVLDIEFNLWSWTRNLCKYGDFCLFVDASAENGILNLLPIPINEIEREEGYDKNDPFAVRFRWLTQGNMILQNWQIIHMRLLGNDTFLPYGQSIIEPARRIWRQLILIEDAMLVYRIVRSPERRMFKIPIGNIPVEEVDRYMEEIQTKLKRNTIVDSQTGRVDLRYNPLSVDEDYFLPYRGTEGPTIETLPGGQFTGDIEDVQYIQNKMFSALHIPKAYLGYEQDIGSKATLAQQDVRFAKTIERVQKILVAELNKIAIIHLTLLGYEGEQLVNFKIEMASPSTIAEQQKLELWRMRFEIAGMAQEGVFDRNTIYKEIFQRNEEQIAKIVEGKKLDAIEDAELEKTKQEASAEAPPPGGEEAAPVPGEEELPQTLGGETQPEGFERGELIEVENPGSEGDDAVIATDKGKNLFSTGEDPFNLVFGTEKQTASDPFDKRAQRRLVTRPFSESVEDNWIKRSLLTVEMMDGHVKNAVRLYERKKKQR